MKDMYFSHDFGARNDPKLIKIQMEMGGQGLAIFWCLVEMLWEQDGYLPKDYKSIAFCLRWATEEDVRRVVEDFELFDFDGELIWSNSALARKKKIENMAEQRRAAGKRGADARYGKNSDAIAELKQSHSDAIAVLNECLSDATTEFEQSHSGAIAIKENKRKENKRKENNSSSCVRAHARGEEEKEQVFKIFFFKNMINPEAEVDRMWDYYEARGWKWGDQEIESVEAVARQWTAETKGPRFPAEFLEWFDKVYKAAVDEGVSWSPIEMLHNVVKAKVSVEGYHIRFWMKTTAGAYTVMNFVKSVGLDKGLKIDYRFMT